MTVVNNKRKHSINYILVILAMIIAGIIFTFDINVPLGVAMGALYCLVIFYSWLLPGRYAAFYSAGFCSILVIIGWFLSASVDVDSNMVGLNRIISLIAIWICAFLVVVAKRGLGALEASEKKYKTLLETAPDGMIITNQNGRIEMVNEQTMKIFNYSKEELLDKRIEMLMPDRYRSRHSNHLKGFLSTPNSRLMGSGMSLFGRRKNGDEFPVEISLSPVQTEEGTLITAAIRDITDKMKAEEKLRQTSDRLKLATEAAKIGIWDYDFETDVLLWDSRMYRIYGLKKETFEITYAAWQMCVHKNDIKRIDKQVSRALAGEIDYNEEFRITWPNGSIHQIHSQALVIRNERGEPVKMVGTNRDVTEEKKSIRLSQNNEILKSKTREMEQFAYVASHDLREPLLTIKNYTQLLADDFGDQLNGEAHHFTKSIINASTRMEDLITELLDYSRLGSKTKKLVAVNCQELIETLLSDLANLIKKNEASVNIKNLPTVMAYPVELKLLFQNLIQNAIKFRKTNQQALIWISAKKVENGFQFCVRDNGIGIEEKHLDKIFTIFRKLHKRKDYEGSGIGLAHAKKIAELHNGTIWVDSEPDKGSSFYFTILTDM